MAPTAVVTTAFFIGILRASYEVLTRDVLRLTGARRRTVLVGEGEQLAALRRTLGSDRSGIRYEFLGAIAPNGDAGDLPVLGGLDAVPQLLREHDVHELIVTDGGFAERDLLELVEEAHRFGAKVKIAPRTTELLLQRAEYIPGEGAPLFELRPPALAGSEWALKRGFDLVVSSFVIVVGLPLWLAVAGAVKLSSRGPVFYRDRRIGLGEQAFGMMKFRTMYADAAERQASLEVDNEASGPLFKIKDDPRVTPLGRFLRRFSLDEMPQVLNVLWGEMSLVGPRPLPIRDYEQLLPWHRKRYLVLPGMTGLWQVSGRIDLSFDDLVRLDFYYIENWSIWLDITILARTLPAVWRGVARIRRRLGGADHRGRAGFARATVWVFVDSNRRSAAIAHGKEPTHPFAILTAWQEHPRSSRLRPRPTSTSVTAARPPGGRSGRASTRSASTSSSLLTAGGRSNRRGGGRRPIPFTARPSCSRAPAGSPRA